MDLSIGLTGEVEGKLKRKVNIVKVEEILPSNFLGDLDNGCNN